MVWREKQLSMNDFITGSRLFLKVMYYSINSWLASESKVPRFIAVQVKAEQ